MGTAEAVNSHKDQGNEFFKAEMWLKAAACYTKGIKDNANDAVLYSNRCAALLKLQKAAKALADAEMCIQLKPDWQKGHYRKGMVLEAMGDLPQALHSYEEAAKLQSGADLSHKITSLKKAIRRGGTVAPAKTADKGTGSTFAFGSSSIVDAAPSQESRIAAAPVIGAVKDDDDYQEAKKSMTNGKAIPLSTHRIQQFGKEIVAQVQQQLHEQKPIKPTVYFLPGKVAANGQEQMGQVQISTAFNSPDLLQNCLVFLRQYASDMGAHAACAIVPKQDIAYPQVWKMKGWSHGAGDGLFVQLEALKPVRTCWFISASTKQAETISNDFKVLEPIFQ